MFAYVYVCWHRGFISYRYVWNFVLSYGQQYIFMFGICSLYGQYIFYVWNFVLSMDSSIFLCLEFVFSMHSIFLCLEFVLSMDSIFLCLEFVLSMDSIFFMFGILSSRWTVFLYVFCMNVNHLNAKFITVCPCPDFMFYVWNFVLSVDSIFCLYFV